MKTRTEENAIITIANIETKPVETRTAREMFDYADALREIGLRKRAIAIYCELDDVAIPQDKKYLISLFKGQALQESGSLEKAERAFRTAFEMNTKTTETFVYLASVYTAQEKFEDAIQVLRGALSTCGDIDEVYLNLAINLRALGNLAEALNAVRKCLELSPDDPDAKALEDQLFNAIEFLSKGSATNGTNLRGWEKGGAGENGTNFLGVSP